MKVRNGFVSNSSSSSFLVVFDKRPESIEELNKIMFNGEDMNNLLEYYGDSVEQRAVVEEVFRDLHNEVSSDDIVREFQSNGRYSHWHWGGHHSKFLDGEGEPYFASNPELVNELKKEQLKLNEVRDIKNSIHKEIFNSVEVKIGERPPYSSGDYKSWQTKFTTEFNKHPKSNDYRDYEDVCQDLQVRVYELQKKACEADAKAYIEANKNKRIYRFEYSDDTNLGSLMEHYGIFDRLEHMRFSHH